MAFKIFHIEHDEAPTLFAIKGQLELKQLRDFTRMKFLIALVFSTNAKKNCCRYIYACLWTL